MEYEHKCIKCQAAYKDTDPDPYYCPPCNEERKAIAKKIDATMGARPKKPMESDLQRYDRMKNKYGFIPFKSL